MVDPIYKHVNEKIFPGFLHDDPEICERVQAFDGDMRICKGTLEFTLPALFEFSCRSYEMNFRKKLGRSRQDYLRFRRALYRNPTNARLKELGGRVELANSAQNHDLTLYRLIRCGKLYGVSCRS